MLNDQVEFEVSEVSHLVKEFRSSVGPHLTNLEIALLLTIFATACVGLWNNYFVLFGIALLAIAGTALSIFLQIREESVLVIHGFGIQLKHKNFFGVAKTKFLDFAKIEGIFIHEYFSGSCVSYCLGFIMKGEQKMFLAFKDIYPGFKSLRKAYDACTE